MKKLLAILMILAMACSVTVAESAAASLQEIYVEAELLMVQGDYMAAATKFEAMGAYSDASQMAMYCKAIAAAESLNMYSVAVEALVQLGEFKDSPQLAKYYTARGYQYTADSYDVENDSDNDLDTGRFAYNEAIAIYTDLALFKDSMMRMAACQSRMDAFKKELAARKAERNEAAYQEALALENAGKYEEAIKAYEVLGNYKDSAARAAAIENMLKEAQMEADYQAALIQLEAEKYYGAYNLFVSLGEYKDSAARAEKCRPYLPAVSAQYTLYSAEGEPGYTYSINFEYDEAGNRIFKKLNGKSNPAETSYVYENGKLISGTEEGVAMLDSGKPTMLYIKQISYNEEGDPINVYVQNTSLSKDKVYSDRTDIFNYEYEYENDLISKKICYLSDGTSHYDVVCEYDDFGRILREITTSHNSYAGGIYEVVEYQYD